VLQQAQRGYGLFAHLQGRISKEAIELATVSFFLQAEMRSLPDACRMCCSSVQADNTLPGFKHAWPSQPVHQPKQA
jgi:hypothetical protein